LSGTLYITIVEPSDPSSPIDSVSNVTISGNSGTASIVPKSPDMIGVGTASGTITVHACMNDPTCATGELAGSPRTVSVTYTVSGAAVPDAVTPHVAVAGVSGNVIIRGTHLTGTNDVKFGATEATQVTMISDTEIHATYPPLADGSYAVSLNSGATAFTGSLVARAPVSYPTETVALPETPAEVSFVRYDADRRALLVGGLYYKTQTTTLNKLWCYTYTGASSAPAWSAAISTPIDGLNDLVLSLDGSRLVAIADAGVLELSPDGTSTLRTVARPNPSTIPRELLTSFAIANDGRAILTTRLEGLVGGQPATYYYDTNAGTYAQMTMPFAQVSPNAVVGTDDGSRVLAQTTGITPSPKILNYAASTSKRSYTAPSGGFGGLVASRDASRIVVDDTTTENPAAVYAGDYGMNAAGVTNPLGTIPGGSATDSSLHILAIIVNPQGTRAFVLRAGGTLHSYALDQPTVNGQFPEVGTGISVTIPDNPPSPPVQTAITPDGGTLFIVGRSGVLVVPAPP
jgi:IPT/TIG domain